MEKNIWMAIDPNIQGMIIAGFKMAGIDFEKDFVQNCPENEIVSVMDSPWVTRSEAAAYAKCSLDTIDNWTKAGHIQHSKTAEGRPGRILIDKNSLEKFIRSKIVNPGKRSRKVAPSVPGGYRVQNRKH